MKVVEEHELTIVPRSLFNVDGCLLDGAKIKSEAVTEVLNAICTKVLEKMPCHPKCAVIDCMRLVNEINPKPRSVKTGDDLANEFLRKLDLKTQGATLVITGFLSQKMIHKIMGGILEMVELTVLKQLMLTSLVKPSFN